MTVPAKIVWDPVFPLPVVAGIWLALLALGVWSTVRGGPCLGWFRRTVLCLLRCAALSMLCIPLLQPARESVIPRMHRDRVALVAVDTSQSMAEKDASGASRLDAARALIRRYQMEGESPAGEFKVWQFDSDSRIVPPGGLDFLKPAGTTTQFDTSLGNVLRSLSGSEQYPGLFVFTDGHDFEHVPVARLGKLARSMRVPIYPVSVGRAVEVPDISVAMISSQPSTFVKQKSRLEAALRFVSCGGVQARVELLRAGKVLREQRINSAGDGEVSVGFDVSEDEAGQFDYEIRCVAQPGERDVANNSAFTFLNVTDARIPVLLIEGEPHWDTSFLQRTLVRNDRVSVDAVSAVGGNRIFISRSDTSLPKLDKITPALLQTYPVVIVGRRVDSVLGPEGVAAVVKAVTEGGQTLIFARGRPGEAAQWDELSPAPFGPGFSGPVAVSPSGAAGSVTPLEILRDTGRSQLPELPAASSVGKPKALASVELKAENSGGGAAMPAMLHRQAGTGQVFSVALDGLWKWSLNPGAVPDNNIYDRFWNQLLLNLIARSSRTPSDKAQLTVAKANLVQGESVLFALRLPPRRDGKGVTFASAPVVRILRDGAEAASVQLAQADEASPWTAQMPAAQTGRFAAELRLPDGEVVNCRFGVSPAGGETTDVSPDPEYLRQLAAASGGRVLDDASLGALLESLSRAADAERAAPPAVERISVWNDAGLFWLIFAVFGADWFLRRRWGLV